MLHHVQRRLVKVTALPRQVLGIDSKGTVEPVADHEACAGERVGLSKASTYVYGLSFVISKIVCLVSRCIHLRILCLFVPFHARHSSCSQSKSRKGYTVN